MVAVRVWTPRADISDPRDVSWTYTALTLESHKLGPVDRALAGVNLVRPKSNIKGFSDARDSALQN